MRRFWTYLKIPIVGTIFFSTIGFSGEQRRDIVPPIISHPDEIDQDFNGIADFFDHQLKVAPPTQIIDVIVILWEPCTAEQLDVFKALGGELKYIYKYVTYGFAGSIELGGLKELVQSLGSVLNIIEVDVKGKSDLDHSTEVVRVRPVVWETYGYTGDESSSMGNIDTGIDYVHHALGDSNWGTFADKVVGWADVALDASHSSYPVDVDNIGHGTHIAGIMAAEPPDSLQYRGVAYTGRLVGIRMDADASNIAASALVASFDTLIALKWTYNIKVANLSSSWPNNEYPGDINLINEANTVVANGIVLTVSAGNGSCSNPGTIKYPGQADSVITVGAINDSGQVAGYSRNGPVGTGKPDVVAPGGSWYHYKGLITSTDNNPNHAYTDEDVHGTSYSAPHVAGVAALVIQALEERSDFFWTPLRVKSIIEMSSCETAQPGECVNDPTLNRGDKDLVEGYGMVQADAAIEAVTAGYEPGVDAIESFAADPTAKKVWARQIDLESGVSYTFTLTNPQTMPPFGDYDLYLYEDNFNPANGDPIIAAKSTTDEAGGIEEIIFNPVTNGRYYLVVKWTEAAGFFTLDSQSSGKYWGDDSRLINNSGSSEQPQVERSGDLVHVVWYDASHGSEEIYYRKSLNRGIDWEPETRLTYSGRSLRPKIAASDLDVHVVWHDNRLGNWRIYYKRSTDGGAIWETDTNLVNISANSYSPDVAAIGDTIHVVWHDYRISGNAEVHYKKSTDGGNSWSSDVQLSSGSGASFAPRIGAYGNNLCVVWMDQRDGFWKIRCNRSTDGGSSWVGDTPLTASNGGSYDPTVAVSGDTIHVVWDDGRDGGLEIYYNRSWDKGATWWGDARLTYNYDGGGSSQAQYPEVEVIGSEVHVVWEDYRDDNWEVYHFWDKENGDWWYTFPSDVDVRLTYEQSQSRRPAIAISENGELHLVWADNRDGNLEIYNNNYIGISTLEQFIRGDVDGNGLLSISDGLWCLRCQFVPGWLDSCKCDDATDANDNGMVSIGDCLRILRKQFVPGWQDSIAPPNICGSDPTPEDPLGCDWHEFCMGSGKIAHKQKIVGGKLISGPTTIEDGKIILPVYLSNNRELSGFAYTVSYDPSVLRFVCLKTESLVTQKFDFVSALPEGEQVTVGAVVSFDFSASLPKGYHHVANLVFKAKRFDRNILLIFTDVELVDVNCKSLTATLSDAMITGLMYPKVFAMSQAFPNPFTGETTIRYQLSKHSKVVMKIYNSAGQWVKTLINKKQPPGYYRVEWNGKNSAGMKVASGVYFYRIEAHTDQETCEFKSTKKINLLR